MKEKIGQLIKSQREHAAMTSSELAEKVGVSQGTISNIENGKFGKRVSSIQTLKKIFGILNVPIDDEMREFIGEDLYTQSSFNFSEGNFAVQVADKFTIPFGKFTEVEVFLKTKVAEKHPSIAHEDKRKMIDSFYLYENGIILDTLKNFIINNDDLKELINTRLQDEFRSYVEEYGILTIKRDDTKTSNDNN
jgi:transcriptional regulator with XRE-family HTH domain